MGDDWPWWHWDPGGLFVDWDRERSVWDLDIEGSVPRGLTQVHSSTQRFVWDPGIGSQLRQANRVAHIYRLLEGKQSWGGRSVIFPFLVSPMIGLGGTSRVRSRQVTCTDWCYQRVQELFGGVFRSFHSFWMHSLDIHHHLSSLAFVPTHSDNFRKFELFMGLTQLVTLKVAFREKYMMEHLSVCLLYTSPSPRDS